MSAPGVQAGIDRSRVTSGLLAALAGLLAAGRQLLWWPLLSVPVAIAVTVAAVCRPALWATGVAEAPVVRGRACRGVVLSCPALVLTSGRGSRAVLVVTGVVLSVLAAALSCVRSRWV